MFFYCLKILICRSYLWHIWPNILSKTFVAHQKRCGSSHICVCFIVTCVNAQEWFLIFLIFLFLGHISGILGLKIGLLYFLTFLILVESLKAKFRWSITLNLFYFSANLIFDMFGWFFKNTFLSAKSWQKFWRIEVESSAISTLQLW